MSGRAPLSLALYRRATTILSPLAPALVGYRGMFGKEVAGRRRERLGQAGLARPAGRLAWLHGASVGEGLSLLPIIQALRSERPDVAVLVTSGTVSSSEVLAGRLPDGAVHQFAPIDTPRAVNAFFDHWRPDLGVLVESEIWPNLILSAKRRGVKMAIASARLSRASLGRWRWVSAAARELFSAFELVLARDEAAARGFAELGIVSHGIADMKFGAAPLSVAPRQLAAMRRSLGDRPVILAASTHVGEEALIAKSFAAVAKAASPRALLVVAPRHPVRAAKILAGLERIGLASGRTSLTTDPAGLDALIADELGPLGLWCRLAAIAIVGGSLVRGVGGHNPLEPARLSCPVAHGPWVENWPVYGEFAEEDAARAIRTGSDLTATLSQAITTPEAFAGQAARALGFVQDRDAKTRLVMRRICELIER